MLWNAKVAQILYQEMFGIEYQYSELITMLPTISSIQYGFSHNAGSLQANKSMTTGANVMKSCNKCNADTRQVLVETDAPR
jgi:hypothetical protein